MRVRHVRRRGAIAIVVFAAALVAARAYLPVWLRHYVNGVLDRAEGYAGRVADVDVALIRGAYRIEDVHLEKEGGQVSYPLLEAPAVDVSIEWGALLHGALVGEIHFREPVAHFVAGPSAEETQTGEEADWGERLDALLPIRINRLEVERGTLHFRAPHRDPPVDVVLHDLHLVAHNWSNVRDRDASRPARAEATARFLTGRLQLAFAADPLAARPDFALDLELEEAELAQLNDFLRAYAGIDVQGGRLGLYTQVEADQGRFEGYLKPLIRGLDVLRVEHEVEGQTLIATVWESLVALLAEVLENQPRDQLGTRIPLSGSFDDPRAGLAAAILNLLRNGYIDALEPELDRLSRESG